MKLLTLPAVLLFAVLPAFADSFNVFMLQVAPDGHQTEIPLTPNGNPLIHSFGPPFEVQVDVPSFVTPIADPIVSVSVILGGQALPLFQTDLDTCPPGPCGFGVALVTPFFPTTVNGVVTVTINDQSETFNFRYFTATTPEPASLLLFGTGLAAVVWRKHRQASGHSP
jgi:hypothetical protein